MIVDATIHDFQFINNLILIEAKNGHFNKDLVNPNMQNFWNDELSSILSRDSRNNGMFAKAYLWMRDDNPIGFVIMSAAAEDNKGNELWMAAITPNHRGLGEGKKMLATILQHFKGKNKILMARCSAESEAMFHILTTSGFEYKLTGQQGLRALVYTD